jgi:CubicO group peptidase (beta-lactamase class C family)
MKYLLFICLSILSISVKAQFSPDSLTHKLDEYFTALTGLKNFNGNVIVAKGDKAVLNKTYNIPHENDSLIVNKESRFIMASVSKVYIKLAILKLVDLNKVKLTDKLDKYIPDFPGGSKITIEHLMEHQSGLPRELTNYKMYETLPLNKIVEISKNEKLQFEPGTKSLYSNVGYFLLHYIIDKSSKKGYNKFIDTNILSKMKLKNTGEYNYTDHIDHFTYGFDREDGKLIATSQANISRYETGNYYTTIEDLYSFSKQILTGNVLKKETALKMFGKDSILVQAGGRSGYRAYFYKNLKTDITFLFLSNYTDMPFQEITEDVIKIISRQPYKVPSKIDRKSIELSGEVLKRYTGKFALEIDKTQTFTIVLKNGMLFFLDGDGNEVEMKAEDEFTFFDNPGSRESFIFELNPATKKYDLILLTEGVKLKCQRIE